MLEWLEISSGVTLVATATRAFLHTPSGFGADPFDLPMEGPGSAATTHWLFEGAIVAAARVFHARGNSNPSEIDEARPLTVAHWAYRLAGYYHTTHATRRLLPVVEQRFAALGRPSLAAWASHKRHDEAGHDQLALRDLHELGYRARDLVDAFVPRRAAAWVELFETLAAADDPVGCVGYAHALERLALLRGREEVRAIEQSLPEGVNATRCLRTHSALGSDAQHVHENVTTTSALSSDERRAVIEACHRTARIYFDPALDDDFHSANLAAKVTAFRGRGRTGTSVALGQREPN